MSAPLLWWFLSKIHWIDFRQLNDVIIDEEIYSCVRDDRKENYGHSKVATENHSNS